MHVLPSSVVRAWEEAAFASGLERATLMTEAVEGCLAEIVQRWPEPGRALVLAGKGHNGNDALALAARLRKIGWQITTVTTEPAGQRADPPLPEIREEASAALVWPARPTLGVREDTVVLDGILGLGASGPARGAARELLLWVNAQSRTAAVRIALDGPSGLDLDTGDYDEATFRADFTLTVGAIKPGLLLDAAQSVVGRLVGIPLPSLAAYPLPVGEPTGETWFGRDEARALARHAPVHAFKHRCGQLGILAGSPGMAGAAVLTANAAVEAGCGLVRLWTRLRPGQSLPGLFPEVMLVEDLEAFLGHRSSALVIGPGLGNNEGAAALLADLFPQITVPTLLDADALNLLAHRPEWWGQIGFPFVLTPHSGELQRLLGRNYSERKEAAFLATERFHGTLVVKGPQTLVTARGAGLTWNGSGNPGMARGGMGDVLSGVIGTLLAQGYSPLDAARLGVFWHGRAGDLAALRTREQAVHARQVSRLLGEAAREIWRF